MLTQTVGLLPLLALPTLTGCGTVPLPPVALPDVELTAPVALNGSVGRLFAGTELFAQPVDARLKNLSVTGQARLNTPASTRLVMDVLLTRELPADCVPYGPAQLCTSGGQSIGKAVFAAGEKAAELRLGGEVLNTLAHGGEGHLGLRLTEGSVTAGTVLTFSDLEAKAYF